MMRWKEPLVLKVQILSPVAIGMGERCNALGFVVEGNSVLVVDGRAFVEALNERQREMFLRWIEPLVGKLAHIREQEQRARGNQGLLRQLRGERQETESRLALIKFMRETLRMPQPVQWLRQKVKVVRYEVEAVTVPNRYEGFSLCLKTPDHRPYIPGNELKGAMRTAVLNALLTQVANQLANLASQLQNMRGTPRQLRDQLRNLWQTTERGLLRAGARDAHYDLFRGISISDSEPMPTEMLRIYAAKRLGMSRDLTVFVEAIAQGSETTVTLSVAEPDRWLEKIGLTDKGGWLDWGKLAQALYEHANSVLDFIAQKFPQIRGRARELKSQNEPEAPLLCIGWGQGFLSVTMTDGLRRQYPQAYEALRQAMAQAISQYGRTKPNNFPKTVWVALDERNQPADLFGWVKLTLQG